MGFFPDALRSNLRMTNAFLACVFRQFFCSSREIVDESLLLSEASVSQHSVKTIANVQQIIKSANA